MNLEQRIKNLIGDLVMQLHAALAKVEELEAKIKTMVEPAPIEPEPATEAANPAQ